MNIDSHAHAIPPKFIEYLGRNAGEIGIETHETDRGTKVTFGDRQTAPMRPFLSDLDARLAWMDKAGIDIQVMAGWIDLTGYEIDAKKAAEYSRAHNDCLAEHAAGHSDRFWPIGTVPLQDPTLAAQELERLMSDGFKGTEIATSVRGAALDLAGLDAFWEVAEATGAFILLHPMTPLVGVDLERYFMHNAVGRPAETSITLSGLIMSGVFERFPKLKMCAVHGGGFTPFQIGRLDQAFHHVPKFAAEHISRPPSEYLQQVYVDTVLNNLGALRFLVDSMGAEQVVLGTDYPFPMGDLDPVTTIKAIPDITDDEVAMICGGNLHALCC